MDGIQRVNSIDIPKPNKTKSSGWSPPKYEYNAALDQFFASSPPADLTESRAAVNRFFEKVADWFDPEHAKPRR